MLEVIALSLDDALRAEAGGATRLEVTCTIEQDGLTPPLDLVERILLHVRIPIRVMLRPRDSFAIADAAELDEICAQACVLAALPIDGLVLGWLRAGAVDVSALRAIAAVAPHLQFTFHRAVERADDIDAALDALRTIPQVDTILHSGGVTLPDDARIAMLRNLHTLCAAYDFTLLAGGGLNTTLIARLRRETRVRAFHLGRAVRRGGKWEGVVEIEGIVNSE